MRVIERDPSARANCWPRDCSHALVLQGDGTDLALLEAEDIGRSDVLVSVIDNDEKNLLTSLLGRQLGVRRIITRVSKPDHRRLFERVGVDVAFSARGSAIASVLHQIEGGQARLLAVLEEGEGRILEFQAPPSLHETRIRDLALPRDSIVGAIIRGTHASCRAAPIASQPAIAFWSSRPAPAWTTSGSSSARPARRCDWPSSFTSSARWSGCSDRCCWLPALVAAYYREWTDAAGFLVAAASTSLLGQIMRLVGGPRRGGRRAAAPHRRHGRRRRRLAGDGPRRRCARTCGPASVSSTPSSSPCPA